MLSWQRIPERVRAGIRLAGAAILLGPAALTLRTWAAINFRLDGRMLLEAYLEITVHFIFYVLALFPFVTWVRTHRRWRLGARAAACAVLAASAAFGAVGVCHWTGIHAAHFPMTYLRGATVGLLISLMLLLVEHLWDSLGEAQREVERRALEQDRAHRSAAEARWTSLESRLHPHFVFNTLASIRELLHRDTRHADLMIQRFAELLRFSLDAPQQPFLHLGEEMRMVTAYLEIEQMRLGSRLAWTIECDPAAAGLRIPSMSVLTLAENAIKHSVSPRRAGGRVDVSARFEGGRTIRLEVFDNGPGFAAEALPQGHGLSLLRERLALIYGGAAEMSVQRRPQGATVALVLPLQVPGD